MVIGAARNRAATTLKPGFVGELWLSQTNTTLFPRHATRGSLAVPMVNGLAFSVAWFSHSLTTNRGPRGLPALSNSRAWVRLKTVLFRLVAAGLLKLIPLEGQKIYRELGLVYRRDRYLSLPSKVFIDVVRESTKTTAASASSTTANTGTIR